MTVIVFREQYADDNADDAECRKNHRNLPVRKACGLSEERLDIAVSRKMACYGQCRHNEDAQQGRCTYKRR